MSTAGEVTETELHESLVAYVASRAPTGVEIVQWELRRGEPLPVMGRIAGVEIASGAEWQERTPLRVQVETDSGPQRTLWVNATLRRARPVVVATQNLPIGHLICAEDVSTEDPGRLGK